MVSRAYAPNSVKAEKRFTQNRERNIAKAERTQKLNSVSYNIGRELIEARQRGEKTPAFITRSVIREPQR